ncbi:MAG: pyruvate dehydrogenase (acetyl-transferring), homodimeric type, partial [Sedimentisphaerales bacterium]
MDKKDPKSAEIETKEWLESLDNVFQNEGPDRVQDLLKQLQVEAQKYGVKVQQVTTTPYINTIPAEQQPPYPGKIEIERRVKSFIRWNAMAMVVRANRMESGIGGHISTYASAATLFEVGFNHFFRAKNENQIGDIIYFQGHAAPGIYARAFLEGRLSGFDLENFRRELQPETGLPSYPHPKL